MLCLVTPALADANNGNWRTAQRWARLLAGDYAVRLAASWPDAAQERSPADVLVALHARRSAPSISAWAQSQPDRPLVLALTGTDLYRDILTDADAQCSLERATRLIVLQDQGPLALPERLRGRCDVVFQSCGARNALDKSPNTLRAVVVGHLRAEKDPETIWQGVRDIAATEGIRIDHIGNALDPALGQTARAVQNHCPHYRWLGGLSHAATRDRIQRAHLLIHPSRMEGGAHVVMEAVRSGTPVLASRIPGNVGLLGAGYSGYFEPGDAPALVALLRRVRASQHNPETGGLSAPFLNTLRAQCAQRAPLFTPQAERAALLRCLRAARHPL